MFREIRRRLRASSTIGHMKGFAFGEPHRAISTICAFGARFSKHFLLLLLLLMPKLDNETF